MAEPHVARWGFGPRDADELASKYGPFIDGADLRTSHFVIEHQTVAVGLVQHYRVRDYPEWSDALRRPEAAGIDYLIGDGDRCGKGLGTIVIRRFVAVTFAAYPDVLSVVAAPQQANVGSWRALEKAGFRRVWEGVPDSDDPSDSGPAYVYELPRCSPVI